MATLAIDSTINVIDKYAAIIAESFDVNSVYIRTKDTLTALVASGDLSSADKAKVISEVMSNINNSLVNASISTALEWAKAEKNNEFKKKELEYQLDVLEQQKLVEEARKKQINAEIMAATAQSLRMYGAATVDPSTGWTTGLSNDGKVYKEIEHLIQQTLNAQEENKVIKGKVRESQAAVYKIVADTAANFGDATYILTDTGCDATINIEPGTLAYEQQQIAKQQARGYAYNAWANAVNAASSTVGMLVADNTDPATAASLMSKLEIGIQNLIAVNPPA